MSIFSSWISSLESEFTIPFLFYLIQSSSIDYFYLICFVDLMSKLIFWLLIVLMIVIFVWNWCFYHYLLFDYYPLCLIFFFILFLASLLFRYAPIVRCLLEAKIVQPKHYFEKSKCFLKQFHMKIIITIHRILRIL